MSWVRSIERFFSMKVAHVITRMIVGGAQENTLFNCLDLMNDFGDEVLLITGPAEGPEGRLLEEGRAGGPKSRYGGFAKASDPSDSRQERLSPPAKHPSRMEARRRSHP